MCGNNGNNMAREIIIEFYDYNTRIVVHRMEYKYLTPCFGRAYRYAKRLMNEYNIKGWFNIRAYDTDKR